jgi:hypothetical protein
MIMPNGNKYKATFDEGHNPYPKKGSWRGIYRKLNPYYLYGAEYEITLE